MRNLSLILITLCLIAITVFASWKLGHSTAASVSSPQGPSGSTRVPPTAGPPSPPPNRILGNEWDQLRTVRDTTLKNNPDLASEYEELRAEMNEQQKELYAAMIKVDPKVASILVKVENMQKETMGMHYAPTLKQSNNSPHP